MDYITVGKILKPQGLSGVVKVLPLTDDPRRFDRLKLVYIDKKPYPVETVTYSGSFVMLKLAGVSDCNAAELLRDKAVEIDRVNAVDPGDGYLICDIVGCVLTDENGKRLGAITDVEQFGAADVIVGETKEKSFRFPFLNRIVHEVNVSAKRFSVKKKLWLEVVVFDD